LAESVKLQENTEEEANRYCEAVERCCRCSFYM